MVRKFFKDENEGEAIQPSLIKYKSHKDPNNGSGNLNPRDQ